MVIAINAGTGVLCIDYHRAELQEREKPITFVEIVPFPEICNPLKTYVSDQYSTGEAMNAACIFSVQGIKSSTEASGSAANRSGSTDSRWFR